MRAAHGVGRQVDSAEATRSAVKQAHATLRAKAVGAQVYVGADHNIEEVAQVLAEMLPGVPLIGCTTDGEISSEGLSVDTVAVLLMASDRITFRVAVGEGLSRGSLACGEELARQLSGPNARALFLLPDGLTGNGSAVIRGALSVLGSSFIIAGGTAGDRGRFKQTHQIVNGKVYTDAIAAMMMDAPREVEIGYGVMSGWRPMGLVKTVTRAEGNTVYTIDGETALDVYSTFLGDKANQLPAVGVEFPFALVDESGLVDERGVRAGEEYILLRAPMAVNTKTGAVSFAAEIPQGARVKMTRAKPDEIIAAAHEAAKRSLAKISKKPDVAFFFSCMARKLVLGRRTDREIIAAKEVFGADVPLFGFYTYGEIANCGEQRPMTRFHNETATFLVISEP